MLSLIIKETLQGKSLARILTNNEMSKIELSGDGIDLGAKSGNASYHRFLKKSNANILFCDIEPSEDKNVLKVDLEKEIDAPVESKDFLLLLNVLEHIYDSGTCLKECARVLKTGGSLIGVVPFLVGYHPDPDDYFRYTKSALEKKFSEAGFSEWEIKPLGSGPFTAGAEQFSNLLKIRPITLAVRLMAMGCDYVVSRLSKKIKTGSEKYALAYMFRVTK